MHGQVFWLFGADDKKLHESHELTQMFLFTWATLHITENIWNNVRTQLNNVENKSVDFKDSEVSQLIFIFV